MDRMYLIPKIPKGYGCGCGCGGKKKKKEKKVESCQNERKEIKKERNKCITLNGIVI